MTFATRLTFPGRLHPAFFHCSAGEGEGSNTATMQRYRADIDGLRALAVIPVVLFHAGTPGFSGGFVGVDVFFVISGYLITQLILREQQDGAAGLLSFYERRVRRIIPALYGVLLFTLITALLLLPPYDLVKFSEGLAAASVFVSNVWFWKQAGYFTLAASSQPLLHLWSLAVEEQFYLVFPLAALAIIRFAPRLFNMVLFVVFICSLGASQFLVDRIDHPAFYLSHLRAWELALGALLAGAPNTVVPRCVREIAAASGLLAIAGAVVLFDTNTPFPGLSALLPTLGATAFLYGNSDGATSTGRILSTQPFRSIGLISYPLYLWHWPLLVFLKATLVTTPTGAQIAATIGLSFALAFLSWKFLETPFRKGNGLLGRRALFVAAGAGALLLFAAGIIIRSNQGFSQRMPENVRRMAAYEAYKKTPQFTDTFAAGTCFQWKRNRLDTRAFAPCLRPSKALPNILLWGDSHAGYYSAGLHALATQQRFHLMQATGAGCRPMPVENGKLSKLCNKLNRLTVAAIEADHPRAAIISVYWLRDSFAMVPSAAAEIAPAIEFLRRRKIPVVLVGPGLVFQEALPAILARRLLRGESSAFDPAPFLIEGWQSADNAIRKEFGGLSGVEYVSVRQAICGRGACPVMATAAVPLVWDNSHLTLEGSRMIAPRLFGNTLHELVEPSHR